MGDELLVLRALGLGDLLVAVPALRALRRHHPRHRVLLATPEPLSSLALRSGAVDEVLPTTGLGRLPHRAPDVAVNLHGTGPESHRAIDATGPRRRIGCRAEGWDGPDWADIAHRHPHERDRWCAVLEPFGIAADPSDLHLPAPSRSAAGAPVLVHPGAQFGAKRWPAARFAVVVAALERAGHTVVVTGSAAERPLALQVASGAGLPGHRVLAGRTDLTQLADLVARAALLVCGDTGVAHLASAFRTPSVVLFGPVPPTRWGPPVGGPHVVLTDAAARRGDPFADDPDPALLGVGVDDVLAAVADIRQRAQVVGDPDAAATMRVVERPGR